MADFYISDFQTGLRALVKAGYGAKVAAFVKPATAVDVTKENRDLSPSFLRWLADRNLSSDDRVMRLKEGYARNCPDCSVLSALSRPCFSMSYLQDFAYVCFENGRFEAQDLIY